MASSLQDFAPPKHMVRLMQRRRTLMGGHLIACVGRRWTVIFCEMSVFDKVELMPVLRDMGKIILTILAGSLY